MSTLRLSQAEKKDEVEKCSCRCRLHILYLVGYFARSDEAEETPCLLCSEMCPMCTKDQFIFRHQMLPYCHVQPHSQSTNKDRQVVQDTWSQLQLKEPEPDYLSLVVMLFATQDINVYFEIMGLLPALKCVLICYNTTSLQVTNNRLRI